MSTELLFNEITANLGVLYFKLHQAHFYVRGSQFFAIHTFYEKLYDEVHEHLDEVAERLLTIGGSPVSTLGEFLQLSTIKEAPYVTPKSQTEFLEETVEDLKILVSLLEKGIGSDFIDEVSEDVLIGMKGSYDKHLWMLSATLDK